MRAKLLIFLVTISLGLPSRSFATPPGVAGALSIVPGLGQVSNGDVLEGAVWFTTVLGLFVQRNSNISNVGFKLWEYQMYDAYRDAGAKDTVKHNVAQNYIATLNFLNLIDP